MRNNFSPISLGEKIKQIRNRKCITQGYLAKAMGANTMTISRIERGAKEVSHNELSAIKKCLEIENAPLLEHELNVFRNRIWIWNDLLTTRRDTEAKAIQKELLPILDLHYEYDLVTLYYMVEVRVLLQEKNYPQAEARLNALDVDNASVEIQHLYHLNKGNLYDSYGDSKKALRHYLKTLNLVSEDIKPNADVYFHIGLAYLKLGKIFYAINYLEAAKKEFNGDRTDAFAHKTGNWLARCYIVLGAYHKAKELLDLSLAKAENCNDEYVTGSLLISLGILYEKMNDYEKSLDFYDKALTYTACDNDLHLTALVNKASLLANMNEYDSCHEVIKQGRNLAKDSNAFTILFDMVSHNMTLYESKSLHYIENVAIPFLTAGEGTYKFLALTECVLLETYYKKRRSKTKALAIAAIARDIYEGLFLEDVG